MPCTRPAAVFYPLGHHTPQAYEFYNACFVQEYSFAHVAPSLVAAAALWLGVKLEAPHSGLEIVHFMSNID
jgi:hypothetical protein